MSKSEKDTSVKFELSSFGESLIKSLVPQAVKETAITPAAKKEFVINIDPITSAKEEEHPTLEKSILATLNGGNGRTLERMAFEVNPQQTHYYQSIYQPQVRLVPDSIKKRVAIQDDLVSTIVTIRANHISMFGRPRQNRHDIGYLIEPKPGVLEGLVPEERKELKKKIMEVIEKFKTCGEEKFVKIEDRCSFSQFLWKSTRNGVTVGKIATEAIRSPDGKFRAFRAIDAGTVYKAVPHEQTLEALRQDALRLLADIKNRDHCTIDPNRLVNNEYTWVQAIDQTPRQAFTSEECLVHNFYPVVDVEMIGYPVPPIDMAIAAITTHINITTHNKLYFQNGRAAKGALVIKSGEIDEKVINHIRQQYNASINAVQNSFRTPVFGIAATDDIEFITMDSAGRDMEFQYLLESNARAIMAAFQISPEEVPGYGHLAKGTNSQAITEGNQEYRLEAARDVGIRPLLKSWEDFINTRLFPLMAPELVDICVFRFAGLDSESAEKESVRLRQDMPVHMTFDDVLSTVEKQPMGREWGGEFPFNPQYQTILDRYFTVGEIKEHFFGIEGASKNPDEQYKRDAFFFQNIQTQMAIKQFQRAAAQPPPSNSGNPEPPQPPPPEEQEQPQQEGSEGSDLSRSIDQALGLLTKSEGQLPTGKQALVNQHKATVDRFLSAWQKDVEEATKKILNVAVPYAVPKKE
jgi:Phage portal protein